MYELILAAATLTLGLRDAIDMALDRSPQYHLAQSDVERASGAVTATRALSFPQLTLSDAHQTQSAYSIPSAGPYRFGNPTVDQLAANVTWSLYSGGAASAAQGQAAAAFAGAVQRYAAARNDLVARTAGDYWTLVAAHSQAEIARSSVAVADANVTDAERRFAAGVAPKADVLREELDAANARSAAVDADREVALANAALAHDLHVELTTTIACSEPLAQPNEHFDRDELLVRAQRGRPELRVAQAVVDAAAFAVRAARAPALPALAVAATESTTHPASPGAGQPQLVAALQATWRIVDGGAVAGNVRAARAGVQAATYALQQARDDVAFDVERAYQNDAAALARTAAAQSARTYADETLRLARVRYGAGVGTALELADARQADARAQADYVAALAAVRTAESDVRRAAAL